MQATKPLALEFNRAHYSPAYQPLILTGDSGTAAVPTYTGVSSMRVVTMEFVAPA